MTGLQRLTITTRSVGRNHGRVPPNAMDRSSAFGGSHPCIRPTTRNFCAAARLWPVDITFGSGLQIPTRVRSLGRNHGRVPPNVIDRSPTFGGSHPCIRPTLRRTGFVIPSVTFCATAGLWSVDITFGSGLQIPTRIRAVGWAEPAKPINRGLGHFGGCRTHSD